MIAQIWLRRSHALEVAEAHTRALVPLADEDRGLEALRQALAAYTHGLVVQALFDPRAFTRKRLLQLLSAHLKALRPN